jgi:hypothetical protein
MMSTMAIGTSPGTLAAFETPATHNDRITVMSTND